MADCNDKENDIWANGFKIQVRKNLTEWLVEIQKFNGEDVTQVEPNASWKCTLILGCEGRVKSPIQNDGLLQ